MAVYIYFAMGSIVLGMVITFIMIFICSYFAIDLSKNTWMLGIPAILSILLNICFIELYDKLKKK